MNPLAALHDPAWQRLGMALIHFVWQGLLVLAAYELWLALFRVDRARQRYVGGLVALVLMGLCPVVTWCVVDVPGDLLASGSLQVSHAMSIVADTSPFGAVGISRLVALWLIGVTLLIARVFIGVLGVGWITRRSEEAPEAWHERVADLCRALGLRSVPRCVISANVREAFAAGFLRPFVIIPAAWLAELPPQVLEAVLAHELSHIRRWDLWVNLAQRIVESLLFYHPAVWWLSRSIRIDREMCCDDLAVSVTKQHVTYAAALETLARRRMTPQLSPLAIGMGGPRMALLARVRNVLGIGSAPHGAVWWPIAVILFSITLAIWMTSGRAPVAAEPGDRGNPAASDRAALDGPDELALRPEDRRWAPPPDRWGPPPGDGPPPRERDRRGPPDRRASPEREAMDRPPTPHEEELMRTIRDLRDEVAELRRDVREIRDRRPPPPPPLPRPIRDLLDSLPRDEQGRPTWGPPPKEDRHEEAKPAGSKPEGQGE